MPRLRRRAAGLLGGAIILFFLGSNVQAGWLFVLAAFLLGTLLAGWILPLLMVRRIEVSREAPAEAFQLQPTPVAASIRNRSAGLRLGLVIEDDHLEPTRTYIPALKPGDRVNVRSDRTPMRRGPQAPAPVVASSSAPFGVAVARRRLVVPGETVVLPAVTALSSLPFIDATLTHERSVHPYPRMGQGPEFLGVREYRPGDGMRHVHWPSTARHGSLIVREFEEETTRRLAIVLDTSNDLGFEWTPLDRCCSAAASIAMAALTHGHGARLITAREGAPDMLARADAPEILDWLARLRPGGGMRMADLVAGLADQVRGVQTAVLVFPTWRTNRPGDLVPAVRELSASVRSVVAVVVEIDPAAAPSDAVLPATDTDALIAALGATGAETYRWRPGDEDIAAVLGLGSMIR